MAPVASLEEFRARREVAQAWLTKREIAHYLGFSVRWVEKQMHLGMPSRRMGGRARFRVADVEGWLSTQEGSRNGVSAS